MKYLMLFLLSCTAISQANETKPYQYDDRDLWFQLPTIEVGEEGLLITELKHPTSKNVVVFINENALPNNGDALAMQALAKDNNVWYLDPADAFLERTRVSIRNTSGDFVQSLMHTLTQQFEKITVVTFDVMSVPVLRGLRQWQSEANDTQRQQLNQLVLLYPSLYINTPIAGEERELFPIAYQSALPITILQPELGAQANTIAATVNALKQGGSLVQLIEIKEGTDGIFKFKDIRKMASLFAQTFKDAEHSMATHKNTIGYPIFAQTPIDYEAPKSVIISGLKKIEPPVAMQSFDLESFDGVKMNVPDSYQNKALLINFWATWCPHCVEEIPSMNRALQKLDASKFAMVSISYKDTHPIMADFLKKVSVDFPILMDYDGRVSTDWKVFAFPSSFIIDKEGYIRYSLNSGAIWDDPDLVEVMRKISEE